MCNKIITTSYCFQITDAARAIILRAATTVPVPYGAQYNLWVEEDSSTGFTVTLLPTSESNGDRVPVPVPEGSLVVVKNFGEHYDTGTENTVYDLLASRDEVARLLRERASKLQREAAQATSRASELNDLACQYA